MRDPVEKWEEDADRMELYGRDPVADVLRSCAAQVREWRRWDAGQLLTRAEAAEILGVREDYISRLIGLGKLTNYGRKGAPRLRKSDLLEQVSPTLAQPF